MQVAQNWVCFIDAHRTDGRVRRPGDSHRWGDLVFGKSEMIVGEFEWLMDGLGGCI